jgi:hypothetical protein
LGRRDNGAWEWTRTRPACAAQDAKHAKSSLKKVVRQLIQYSHRLRSRSARKKIDETVREPLAESADGIQNDVRELKDTLGCT